jgi:hypothetical protein
MRARQLELGLGNGRACRPANLRHHRRSRGREWFERMRQVVDKALERKPDPFSGKRRDALKP